MKLFKQITMMVLLLTIFIFINEYFNLNLSQFKKGISGLIIGIIPLIILRG
jgi:hypothetical protein